MPANLNRRIHLRDADRAPHRGNKQDGCMPLLLAYSLLAGAALVVILVTQPWK